jgi:hypothetical protein
MVQSKIPIGQAGIYCGLVLLLQKEFFLLPDFWLFWGPALLEMYLLLNETWPQFELDAQQLTISQPPLPGSHLT